MNVYDAIVSRRTIRKFRQTPIPEDVLKKMINAARFGTAGVESAAHQIHRG